MSKRDSDILQIRKYLNGELDAGAMHRLERRAQDDPFLMDAMEGYQTAGRDQQANLAAIGNRLNQRIAQKRARVIPLRVIGIAASVLIVCSVGIWWLKHSDKPAASLPGKQVAETVKPTTKQIVRPTPAPVVPQPPKLVMERGIARQSDKQASSVKTIVRPALASEAAAPPVDTSLFVRKTVIAETSNSIPTADQANKDTTPLNEMIVMGYNTNKKKDTPRIAAQYNEGYLKKPDTANPVQVLQARVPGVTVTNTNSQHNLNGLNLPPGVAATANQLLSQQMTRGDAIAPNNNGPLPAASVRATGSNANTSPSSRKFALKADTVEFKAGQISIGIVDSAKNTAPGPEVGVLKEVSISNSTVKQKQANRTLTNAHPQKGWELYKKYLTEKAVSPDGMAGVVKLTLTIDRYGTITAVKVIKGISAVTDQKAIKIVKDGPAWTGNANNEPEKVSLEIKFGN